MSSGSRVSRISERTSAGRVVNVGAIARLVCVDDVAGPRHISTRYEVDRCHDSLCLSMLSDKAKNNPSNKIKETVNIWRTSQCQTSVGCEQIPHCK